LDDRPLLRQALTGMLSYLLEQKADQYLATFPRLTGNRTSDWQIFARTYIATIAHLPSLNEKDLVYTIIKAMVDSLHDDHASFLPDAARASTEDNTGLHAQIQSQTDFGPGMRFGFYPTQLAYAAAPLVVREVIPDSPAAQAGIRPGDTIVTVNGLPPFLGKELLQPVLALLSGQDPVKVQIQRPGTTTLITLTPSVFPLPPMVSSRQLSGNILYVRLTRFETGATQQISTLVQQAGGPRLRGMILDLRGNGGGEVAEQQRLLGLFVHDRGLATFVDGQGQSSEQKPDAHVALLHLALVALIDHECASACENTAIDIRDLHLGRLVGERTAGLVSGPSTGYFLDDGSVLILPAAFMYGPAGEMVDGIGVPPDEEVQPTPTQLAAGQDPVLAKALQDFF
ncbi:MAG TPA: S41 family peptidase, partial [Ktedonobacteraceae bacterium]|nr:S41 family peptidase [Ktedonobacteraceae bacterium]